MRFPRTALLLVVALAGGLRAMSGYALNGIELMPDALEQAQLEYAVAGRLAIHALAGGERRGLSDAALNQIVIEAQRDRAECRRATGRTG